jgi:nicotinamidase-related amidase
MKSDVLEWHAELDSAEVEPHPAFALYPGSVALLVIDMQVRLGAAMPEKVWKKALKNTQILLKAAEVLEIPVIVTEQYSKGLGPTDASLESALPKGTETLEKMDFSCAQLPGVRSLLEQRRRRQLIVVGQETHVCVFQSVRHFVERGMFCHVVSDACLSRTKENWRIGLRMMDGAGASITSTETVLFDLLKTAEHPAFRDLSRLVR